LLIAVRSLLFINASKIILFIERKVNGREKNVRRVRRKACGNEG
jgi:hypothetical protein